MQLAPFTRQQQSTPPLEGTTYHSTQNTHRTVNLATNCQDGGLSGMNIAKMNKA
ncbi:MAG: hypothetical protein ACREBR_03245 [bacterium]